jgi:hypothetical protein
MMPMVDCGTVLATEPTQFYWNSWPALDSSKIRQVPTSAFTIICVRNDLQTTVLSPGWGSAEELDLKQTKGEPALAGIELPDLGSLPANEWVPHDASAAPDADRRLPTPGPVGLAVSSLPAFMAAHSANGFVHRPRGYRT